MCVKEIQPADTDDLVSLCRLDFLHAPPVKLRGKSLLNLLQQGCQTFELALPHVYLAVHFLYVQVLVQIG